MVDEARSGYGGGRGGGGVLYPVGTKEEVNCRADY